MITEIISLCIASYFVNGCNVYENYQLKKVFISIDKDGDGLISYQEFEKWFTETKQNGYYKFQKFLYERDFNNSSNEDDQLNFEEFKQFIKEIEKISPLKNLKKNR